MILKGKLYEVGNLENGPGRGIRIESEGKTIELTGLSEDECREAAKSWGEFVTITIEPSADMTQNCGTE